MKKMILGIVWQVLGFLGAYGLWLYAVHHRWNSYTVIKTLVGTELMLPFIISIVLFAAGVIVCLTEIKK